MPYVYSHFLMIFLFSGVVIVGLLFLLFFSLRLLFIAGQSRPSKLIVKDEDVARLGAGG